MKSSEIENFALITGASKGLGRSFATELACKGKNLLLVSLPGEGLALFARELVSEYLILALCYECDLSDKDSACKVAEWASGYDVDVLINNAGIGGAGMFDETDSERIEKMIAINVMALAMLTRLMMPCLLKQEESFVLNVSSLAAFGPFAYKTVYPATKSFVTSFSRGLNEEFRNRGLCVSVVHPGPMATNEDVKERIEKLGLFGRMGLLTTGRVARIALNGMYGRRAVIVPGAMNRVNWLLLHLVPVGIRLRLVGAIFRREFRPGV